MGDSGYTLGFVIEGADDGMFSGVFGVSGDALGLDMIVTVIGNSSTTISGLRIGKYQVTELTNWKKFERFSLLKRCLFS